MRVSLRLKLGLISLILLLLPLAGWRFSELIKRDLLESRRETMLFSARAVASALSGRTALLDKELFHSRNPRRDLYLYKLSGPIRMNGKLDDWQPQSREAQSFGKENLLYSRGPYRSQSLSLKHLLGVRGDYLYSMFEVTDDRLVYRQEDSSRQDQSDFLEIGIEDSSGGLQRYFIAPSRPGWVTPRLQPTLDDPMSDAPPPPEIEAVWEETAQGYIIELRIALRSLGRRLAFAIGDVDDPVTRQLEAMLGTASATSQENLGWLLSPSGEIVTILQSLNRPESRISIVDRNRRIRASYGSLQTEESVEPQRQGLWEHAGYWLHQVLDPVYRLFTESLTASFPSISNQPSTLDIRGLDEALKGVESVTSIGPGESEVEIMAAVVPLREGDKVIGAVVVEQATTAVLALQNRLIEESITLTVVTFGLGGLAILAFATRLSWRIRRLGRQAAEAVQPGGRIRMTIPPSTARDEIGELSRNLVSLLAGLERQTAFREKMADNLEHELRTPLAGISASLKNLAGELQDTPATISRYLDWALQDVARMEELLASIRDAASLQEALEQDFKEEFDLGKAISLWLEHSWAQAFPEVHFSYQPPESSIPLNGDPSRIRQLLDKLVENAVSFHEPGTSIEIHLARQGDTTSLQVLNRGPVIPLELRSQIFDSLVSMRRKQQSMPHLGLGLYVARTIVEHHGGSIRVDATPEEDGTVFTILL